MPRRKNKVLRVRPPMQRMMQIHTAIKAGRFPNARTLAVALEMHPRSIARDIDFMRDRLQLPIAYEEVKHGYYYTREVDSFPAFQISEGELFALLVAEKAMQQYRGTNFEKPLMSALKKMSEGLPDTVSFTFSEWDDAISFRTTTEPVVDLKMFDSLARATARREQLKLSYRKPGGKSDECRVVDPYHLANVNGEWFLFGYCHLRQDIRTFVPARMRKVEKTGRTFKRNDGFSLQKQLRDSFGVHSGKGEFHVVVRFSDQVADYIREKKWHPSQKLRELKNGEVELHLTLSSLIEVRRWILSWGQNARVIAPQELVADVLEESRQIGAAYGGARKRRRSRGSKA